MLGLISLLCGLLLLRHVDLLPGLAGEGIFQYFFFTIFCIRFYGDIFGKWKNGQKNKAIMDTYIRIHFETCNILIKIFAERFYCGDHGDVRGIPRSV